MTKFLALFLFAVLIGGCAPTPTPAPDPEAKAPVQAEAPKPAVATAAVTYDIKGMTCNGCADTIEKKLKEQPGVVQVKMDFLNTQVAVDFDPKRTDSKKVAASINAEKLYTLTAKTP